MKRSFSGVLCILVLAVTLAACEATPLGESPAATPTASAPVQAPTPTPSPAPLDEAAVRDLFEQDGEFRVIKLTPCEGDYLAEVTGWNDNSGCRDLYWVFGETGEKVWLTRDITGWEIDRYHILSPGSVEIRTTGKAIQEHYLTIPRVYHVFVTVDSKGWLTEGYVQSKSIICSDVTPHGGWRVLNGKSDLIAGDPSKDGYLTPSGDLVARYEQVYDARIGVDDVSFSFIPSGNTMERFTSFFPAAISTPNSDCSFDPETRKFTIRFYSTALESGGITDDEIAQWAGATSPYLGLYPYTFPAGSLGAGNRFIRDAAIAQDGKDTVVTLTLTQDAYAYDVGRGGIGWEQKIPTTRVTFRERISGLDG